MAEENKYYIVRTTVIATPYTQDDKGDEILYIVAAKNESAVQKLIEKYTKDTFHINESIHKVIGTEEIKSDLEGVIDWHRLS